MEGLIVTVFFVICVITAYVYVAKQERQKRNDALIQALSREVARRYITCYRALEKTKGFASLPQHDKYARVILRVEDDVHSMNQAHDQLGNVRRARWSSKASHPLSFSEIVIYAANSKVPYTRPGDLIGNWHDDESGIISKTVSSLIPTDLCSESDIAYRSMGRPYDEDDEEEDEEPPRT